MAQSSVLHDVFLILLARKLFGLEPVRSAHDALVRRPPAYSPGWSTSAPGTELSGTVPPGTVLSGGTVFVGVVLGVGSGRG